MDHNSLRSLVAVSDNKIAGHISYIISRFRYMGLEFSGVFPYAWIVSPEHKGSGIGSKLMKKVCEMADFTYFFGGSAQTLKVVPFMGFGDKLWNIARVPEVLNESEIRHHNSANFPRCSQ